MTEVDDLRCARFRKHLNQAPWQMKGVSGFLCLGRLFQGQPNEAALCI